MPESCHGTPGLIRNDLSQIALGSSRVLSAAFFFFDSPDCRIKAFQKSLDDHLCC